MPGMRGGIQGHALLAAENNETEQDDVLLQLEMHEKRGSGTMRDIGNGIKLPEKHDVIDIEVISDDIVILLKMIRELTDRMIAIQNQVADIARRESIY